MPREARNFYNGNLYHIMSQGINKEDIFYNDIYKKLYIKLMYDNANTQKIKILSYCIMKNHVHLLLNIKNVKDMSDFMKIINMKYAMIYNKRERRVGVVFRNRYESELIYNEEYFYNCVRYIHNNPVKAGIVKNAKEYRFSSANDYSLEKILEHIRTNTKIESSGMEDFIDVDKDVILAERIQNVINEFCQINNIKNISLEDKRLVKLLVYKLKENTNAKNVDIANRLRNIKSDSIKLFKE